MFEPSLEACARSYEAGQACLVSTRLAGDLETPVSAFLKLSAGRAGRIFLLESVEGGAARGRFSMIGLDPDIVWRVSGGKAEINRRARADPGGFSPSASPPLVALRELIAELRIETAGDLPPMAAGIFGYLGYDMVRQMERLAEAGPDSIGVPDALMLRPTVMVVFDAVRDEIIVVTPLRPDRNSAFRAAHDSALERLESVVATLEGPTRVPHAGDPALTTDRPRSNTPKERFFEMVERAKDYIRAGDIFQVVLSQRFSAPFPLPAFALYRALRQINPAPFLCFLDFGLFQIVCSSPEILVRVRGGKVTDKADRGHPLARQDEGRGRASGGGALGRRKGMRRAFDAARSRPQRRRARRRNRLGRDYRNSRSSGTAMSCISSRTSKAGSREPRCDRCFVRGVSGRHCFRRAKSAGDGNHRRTRGRQARHLWRLHRLFRRRGRDGHLYRLTHRDHQGWNNAC